MFSFVPRPGPLPLSRDAVPRTRGRPVARLTIFYGWWIVAACLASALVGNALGLFGAGVYLRALSQAHGWPIGIVSGAATLFYVVSAVLLLPIGGAITRFGPRPVVALGGIAMAGGVAG